jgi:hypothetical protein
MSRLIAIALISVLPLAAGTIDVTDLTYVNFHHDATLVVDFTVWNYAAHNPSSPYPTSLGLNVVGAMPGLAPEAVPGSSASYFPGYLFEAYLESEDGSISVPLDNGLADLLGEPDGMLVLIPGVVRPGGGSAQSAGILAGNIQMTYAVAQTVFGSDYAARIVLRNLGDDFLVGIGPGYSVRNAITEPGVRGRGSSQVSGITTSATLMNPEPGTWAMAAGAGLLLLFARARRRPIRIRNR